MIHQLHPQEGNSQFPPRSSPQLSCHCTTPSTRACLPHFLNVNVNVFFTLKVTPNEAQHLANATSLQSLSLIWHEHRLGRITASRFGLVCHTKIDKPSKSLVSSIIQRSSFTSPATKWGIDNEDKARQEYFQVASTKHTSLTLSTTGLCVNPLYPHLGASPDALIECTCCGRGVLEIKCPYNVRDVDPTTVCKENFFLKQTSNGPKLVRSHNYYYQVQGQLAVCDRSYCDFVCWTPHGIHVERIARDLFF